MKPTGMPGSAHSKGKSNASLCTYPVELTIPQHFPGRVLRNTTPPLPDAHAACGHDQLSPALLHWHHTIICSTRSTVSALAPC